MKVELGQIEKNDIPFLRDVLNKDFTKFFDIHSLVNCTDLNKEFKQWQTDFNAYLFSIKSVESGDFAKSIIGFCGLTNIDWVARHSKLLILMSDKHGNHLTIDRFQQALDAFKLLIRYGFFELNLNKVWLEVPQGLDIRKSLEALGFVAEGVKMFSRMIDGTQVSSTLFSLLVDEYRED